MKRCLVALTAATLAGPVVLSGCGASDNSAGSGDGPAVVASFYPLAFAAERVAGDHATVVNLTEPGAEAHDAELTGRQVGQIADADLVVYLAEFQPAVDEAAAQNAGDRAVDVAEIVSNHTEPHAEPDDEHAHDGEHEGEANEGAHEGHDHGDLEGDPHFWLDPANVEALGNALADRLADIDPDNAEAYRDNADALAAELQALDQEFTDGLARCQRDVIVVAHEAFGYLADRYGLEQVGISGLDPEAEPSPDRLAEAQDVVRAEGITTIFYERLVSSKVAETLADDLGVQAAVLDPIEGLTDETEGEDYLSLMRANLDALRTANGCR
jgi:zinc transport system substrate-binding protein